MARTPNPVTARHLAVPVLVLLLLVVLVVPAAAHPFLRGGGEVPVDSLATATLDLAHGCGSETAASGEDTLEVALEVPEWLRVVSVAAHAGYDHALEVVEGRVAVVVWTAAAAPEPAPTLDLEVVVTGEPGETRHLAVFQGCEVGSHRWIGTPDAPADDPAINVRLVAADPDRPAPPPETLPDPDAADPDAAEPDAEGGPEEGATGGDEVDGDQDADQDADADDAADGDGDADGEPAADEDAEVAAVTGGLAVDGTTPPRRIAATGWVIGAVVLLVVGGVLVLVLNGRSRRAAAADVPDPS